MWVATVVLDSRAWRGNSVTACRYQQPRREPTQPVSLGVGLPLNLTTGKFFLDGTRIVAEGLVELLVQDPDRGRCASMTEVASIANETRAAMTVPLNEKCATRPGGSERCQKRKQASPTGVAGILHVWESSDFAEAGTADYIRTNTRTSRVAIQAFPPRLPSGRASEERAKSETSALG